jgi:hypothetical protein
MICSLLIFFRFLVMNVGFTQNGNNFWKETLYQGEMSRRTFSLLGMYHWHTCFLLTHGDVTAVYFIPIQC